MVLFSLDSQHLTRSLLELPFIEQGGYAIIRHPNKELCARITAPVQGKHCFIMGSITPPEERFISLLLLSHTLKKEGAARVSAIIPYLSYSRHDKEKPGESNTLRLVGGMCQQAGIDEVVTVDIHSERGQRIFPIPLTSLSPAELFAKHIIEMGLSNATLVVPDEGAIARCEQVRSFLHSKKPIVYFKKKRTEHGITQEGPIGEVTRSAIILDDILDTGGTLVSSCQKLRVSGVSEITIMVTHGLFTQNEWTSLWNHGVTRIITTDTVPLPKPKDNRITQISVFPLLRDHLTRSATSFLSQPAWGRAR